MGIRKETQEMGFRKEASVGGLLSWSAIFVWGEVAHIYMFVDYCMNMVIA